MRLSDYQRGATETAVYPEQGNVGGLMYAALGLAGEAGEIANKVKKVFRDGATDSPDKRAERMLELQKELGDVLWYVAALATELGCDLDAVARGNLQKLQSRKARGVLGGSGDDR